jgi:hypothetical protein
MPLQMNTSIPGLLILILLPIVGCTSPATDSHQTGHNYSARADTIDKEAPVDAHSRSKHYGRGDGYILITNNAKTDDLNFMPHWIMEFSNHDVEWSKTNDGLVPMIDNRIGRIIKLLQKDSNLRARTIDELHGLTDDPDRFLLVHVVLTIISEMPFEATDTQWNHVTIDFSRYGDGKADKSQISIVSQIWPHSRPR